MCVPQRYLNAFMTEPVRNRHRRKAHVDQQGNMAVPLRYNYDKPEESRNIKGFQGFKPDF